MSRPDGIARDRPLVLKLGGAAIESPEQHGFLWESIAALHRARPDALILVHGGGAAIDDRLRALGMTPMKRDGIRITPPEQISEVVAVLRGIVNTALVAALAARGCRAVGLSLGDGGMAEARRATRFAFDPGQVGEIIGGDPAVLRALLAARALPVIAPIALGPGGEALNINADDAAAGVARIARAAALVLLTDVPGVLDASGRLIARLNAADAADLIARGVIHGGMIPKVRGALDAARQSGAPAIIAPWSDPATFARLAEGEPAGTTVEP